ncbi:hypothetical protein B9Z19DRAFT_141782 [Tuber borchii]|uniref:Uncharacterized protein n=1 Tax=Tuber borchii TaxID=42251 RepID=A0A2T6ZQI7_TUBBO|nr:hypothetical protein B9Z19DRAFT_141782 [Tuber borchii]
MMGIPIQGSSVVRYRTISGKSSRDSLIQQGRIWAKVQIKISTLGSPKSPTFPHKKLNTRSKTYARVIIHSATVITAHGPNAQLSTGTCLHWQPTSRLPPSPLSPPPHAANIVVLLRIQALPHNPLPTAIVDPIGLLRAAPPPSPPTMARYIESLAGKKEKKKCQGIGVPGMVTALTFQPTQ